MLGLCLPHDFEVLQVYTAGHHSDLLRRCPVVLNECAFFLVCRSDNVVAVLDQTPLCLDAKFGLLLA